MGVAETETAGLKKMVVEAEERAKKAEERAKAAEERARKYEEALDRLEAESATEAPTEAPPTRKPTKAPTNKPTVTPTDPPTTAQPTEFEMYSDSLNAKRALKSIHAPPMVKWLPKKSVKSMQ